jgi:AraC-like DNA-binding protein
MTQKTPARDRAASVKGAKEPTASQQLFDTLSQIIPFSQGLLISALPRGSIYIVQPAKVPETLLRSYGKDLHREDRVAWQAILRGQTVRATDCWSAADFQASPYLHRLLQPNGLRYAVAAPVAAPVFNGYPGAVVLFRGPDEGNFSDADMGKLRNLGKDVDEFIAKGRQARNTELALQTDPWTHAAPNRIFIFNKDCKSVYPKRIFGVEERLEAQLKDQAMLAIEFAKRGQTYPERLLLADARGDKWAFHLVVYREFPALGPGMFVFICLQPESFDWVTVRPADLASDPELVRMLPTLKFMQQEFHKNPTLHETSKRAHLSPFHFHRRFVDLIGQTPKHFMLGCQIHEAQRLLASRRRELALIASDCGFAHQSHFTSRFKQATGLTPTRWRRLANDIVRAGGRK